MYDETYPKVDAYKTEKDVQQKKNNDLMKLIPSL